MLEREGLAEALSGSSVSEIRLFVSGDLAGCRLKSGRSGDLNEVAANDLWCAPAMCNQFIDGCEAVTLDFL